MEKETEKGKPVELRISSEDAQKLWKRLFGEEDKAELRDLSNLEFDRLVEILELVKTPIEYEIDRAGKSILLWKPKDNVGGWKEYAYFLFLLSMLKGGAAKTWLQKPIPKKLKRKK